MAVFSTSNGRIAGIASAVPKTSVDNTSYAGFSTEQERDLFIQTTGVARRRVATGGLTCSDMCFTAAQSLIDGLAWNPEEIDLLVFVSQSPDYFLPATSVILQDRLGLGNHALALDINLGCSGYVYGLSLVQSYMSSPAIRKALLLVGDVSTRSLNERDKSVYPLFGDAGTATAITNVPNITWFNLQSDGSGKDAIIIPGGGTRNYYSPQSLDEKLCEDGMWRHSCNLLMNGADVFSFALREVKPNLEALLLAAGVPMDQLEALVMHQANRFMTETIRKKCKLPAEKVPYSISEFGNTSSASIPLTITTQLSEQVMAGCLLGMAGFGVGLSWGSALVDMKGVNCLPLIEV
jgi:3-oxoacyl-[acyl-carrier-protein] synthase-3